MIIMSQGKLVRLSSDTIEKLGKVRNGFETPNDCINRILENRPCNQKTEPKDEEEESE